MTSSNTPPDTEFAYTVVYSDRRTVGITVERDGSVVVRAPRGIKDDELRRVISSRKRWVSDKVRHPQKYKERAHPPGKELVSGESMLFLGRSYRVEIVESGPERIEFDQKFIVPRSVCDRGREEFRRWYVRAAEERLVPRVTEWARRLGVEVGRVRIADDRYRWGSCTPRGNVSVNWRLVKAPPSVSDYVIVHELAHLLEANHGDPFWSIVRSHIPRVEASRTWLREHGQLLEQEL
jgi:predicted metal-dependent hydrolase